MGIKNKRNIRISLTSLVLIFMFISSWVLFGVVLALTSANVNLGGSIHFTATNIYADVTGAVTGTVTKNTLEDMHFSASTKNFTTPTSWSNMTLDFQKNVDIVVTINVKNKSSERSIWITFTDNITSTNTDITRKSAGATVTAFNILEVPKSETKSIEVTLHVTDQNSSVSGKFDLGIHLDNTAPEASKSDIQYAITNSKAVISGYTGSLTTFSIPETIDGYPTVLNSSSTTDAGVTLPSTVSSVVIPGTIYTVPDKAFFGNTNLTSIILGEGIKVIQQAFNGCSSLLSITIPSSVTSIGSRAFYHCSSLKEVIFAGQSKLTSLGASAFDSCTSLTSIAIPDGVTDLQSWMFNGCTSLSSVTLSPDLTAIGEWAFSSCKSLTSVTVSSSVKTIGSYAFYGCSKLSSATFKEIIGWKAGDTALKSSDLADKSKAATFLNSTYCKENWTRS